MRLISSLAFIVLFVANSYAQVNLCCTEYEKSKSLFHFSVVNATDSILRFSFMKIEDKTNIIKHYRIAKDTLIIYFLEERKNPTVSASGKLNYVVDGELFYQRKIKPSDTLKLAVKLKVTIYNKIKNLKLVLPNGTTNNSKLLSHRNR